MGMTIEELRDYVDQQRDLNNIPYHVYSTLIDELDLMADTMRKYQKIQEILKAWNDNNSFDSMIQISEVIEDGSENNHHASNT